MWGKMLASWRILSPAIWGKLPGHADFVRCGMRHGESEAWMTWIAQQSPTAGAGVAASASAMPVAFVLPPGTLEFAQRRFVLGVIAPSFDMVGRHYPLVVYQQAHPLWIRRHFEAQHGQPLDWQFWLARAVARHIRPQGRVDVAALEATLRALWREQLQMGDDITAQRVRRMKTLLDRCAGPASADDPAAQLHGVRHLPWADWPRRLQGARAESAFWQQDAEGRFISAGNRLQKLWSGPS